MASWTFSFPGHPTRLNEFLGRHWSVGAKRKKTDRDLIGWMFRAAGIPLALVRRRVRVTIHLAPAQRAGDDDGYRKSLLDALVHCGALRNDSPAWAVVMPFDFVRGNRPKTTVLLEDFPSESAPKARSRNGA